MDDFLSFLKGIAPTVAGLIGTPAAGIAVEAMINAFGGDTDKANAILAGNVQMTSDDIAKVKIAEIEAKSKADQAGIDLERLAVDDRKSAREREAAVKDSMPRILAFTIIGSFVAMCAGVLFGKVVADSVMAGTVIGYLSAKAEQVTSYYFGSSAGSARKTELMGK